MRMLYLCKCIQAVKIVRSGRCTNFLPPTRKNHPDWNDLQ